MGEKTTAKAASDAVSEQRGANACTSAGSEARGPRKAGKDKAREAKAGGAAGGEAASGRAGAAREAKKASSTGSGEAGGKRAGAAREKLSKSIASGGAQAKEALGRTEALVGLALGCMLAWVPMTFQSLNIVGDAGEPVLDMVYLVSIVALLATQLFIGVRHAQCALWLTKTPTRWAAAAVMAASTLLLPFAAGWADGDAPVASFSVSVVITVVAGVASGVSSGMFLAQFGILVSKFSAKATAAVAAIGYLSMSALFCAYSFFGPLESCLFAASMPIISAFLRDTGANTEKSKAAILAKPLPPQALPANPEDRRQLRHLTIAFAVCCALVGCANELARTLYIQMGIVGAGANYALAQTGAALIIGLGATVITLALVSMKTPRAPEYCHRILMLFLALGSLLLPVSLIYPIPSLFPYAVNSAAFQCFGILAWVLICGTCHQFPTASVRTFSLIRAGWTFGPIVGLLIGRFVVHCTPFDLAEVFPCAIIGGTLIMLTSMAFTEHDLATAVNLLPTDKRRRFTNKCQAVAARCGLSERETEIMTLFAKGRNLAYIQDQLCLSKSTVSTHRQHIYQKLGVHSSQEMIDLIQEEKA